MLLLITGGAGFIGRAVVTAALSAGHDVRVLDRAPERVPDGAEPVAGDVRDPAVVAAALRGVDAVSHQAAKVGLGVDVADLPGYAGDNDLGTAVLLAGMARAGTGALVLAGSMVVYGEGRYRCEQPGCEPGDVAAPPRAVEQLAAGQFEPPCPRCARPLVPGLVDEDARPDPRNAYAVSKLAQEGYARVWARETGAALITLRYHNVYGPGLPRDTPYAGVAAIFGSALARGQAPTVFEDGAQRRDFVHVTDVAAANLAATAATVQGRSGTFNVASGEQRTVLDLARELALAVAGPEPVVTGEFRLGDVRHVTADTSRIRRELAWRPAVRFADGIRDLAPTLAH